MHQVSRHLTQAEGKSLLEVLASPLGASDALITETRALLYSFAVRCALDARATHCSLKAEEADVLGERIFVGGRKLPAVLMVDWLVSTILPNGQRLTRVVHRFCQATATLMKAIVLVDPLPCDYKPMLMRMLKHIETPGLDRVEIILGFAKPSWLAQFELMDENTPDPRWRQVTVKAAVVLSEDYDLETLLSRLAESEKNSMTQALPAIVRRLLKG